MARRLMSLTAPLATLAEIEAAVWAELSAALHTRGHAWRQAVLATAVVDADGSPRADARTVILREVDAGARTLAVYADARSAKVGQIAAQPRGTLLLWSAALGWQARLQVRLAVATEGPQVAARWDRLRATPAAQDYLSAHAPGSTLEAPQRDARSAAPASPATPDAPAAPAEAPAHFALLTASVLAVDWLELHAEGHRRALFDAAGPRWLAP